MPNHKSQMPSSVPVSSPSAQSPIPSPFPSPCPSVPSVVKREPSATTLTRTDLRAFSWRPIGPANMGGRVDEYVVAMYGDATNSPLQGDMPTDRFVVAWPVDPVQGAASLDALPPDLPGGEYTLIMGLYDPTTQQRLPLLRDNKPAGDSYTLATIHVP